MPYLYDNHLGGFYSTKEQLSNEECYCDFCNDYDAELGEYNTLQEAWSLLKDRTSIFGTGGYCLDSVCSFITNYDKDSLKDMQDWEMLQLIEAAIFYDEHE